MTLNDHCKNICKKLIDGLPPEEQKQFSMLLDPKPMIYIDNLHKGLTLLVIACMEMGVLFSKFENEKEVFNHNAIVKRMTVGYLFESYNSLWSWVGSSLKAICEDRNLDIFDFLEHKKRVDLVFSQYIPLLKAVRNGAFHIKDESDNEWITLATNLLYQRRVPQTLRHSLYEYGYNLNIAAHNAGIYGCYPGIGGFMAIIPGQGIAPMKDMYLAGTNIKYTPEKPAS